MQAEGVVLYRALLLGTLSVFYHCEMTITTGTTIPCFRESTLAGEGVQRMQREPVAVSWVSYHSGVGCILCIGPDPFFWFLVCKAV